MEDIIDEYAWQFHEPFDKCDSYEWEMTGIVLDATTSHIWVFYIGNYDCIVLERFLGSSDLRLLLTHEDVDYWICRD